MKRHRRRVVALTATGILVAATLIGGGWWLGQRGPQRPAASSATTTPMATSPTATTSPPLATLRPPTTITPSPSPVPTAPLLAGTWRRLPAAPLAGGLHQYASVWTGRELLVFGVVFDHQATGRSAGAAYNPVTRTWRKLPSPPVPVQNREGGYHAVWTGTEMLGWGMGLDAAYNPTTNRWRRLSGSVSGPSVMVWTGRQVLTWGGGCCGDNSADGAAYTPSTDTWRPLPRGPLTGRHTSGVWTGRELIVAGGTTAEGKLFGDAAAYNPSTHSWRRLAAMPAPRARATASWTGTEVLVVGGYGPATGARYLDVDGLAYNPAANRWRRLPATAPRRVDHTGVWTGSVLLVWGGRTLRGDSWVTPPHGLVYDPASNRWSDLPVSPLRGRIGHVAAWTGSQLLIWGGHSVTGPDKDFTDGAAYTPPPV